MSARFDIGALDWDHAAWQASFYPDDLPADWRLTYYANEFPLVLVPEARWLGGDAAQWIADVHDRFGFYLQVLGSRLAEPGYADTLRRVADILGVHLAGLVDFEPAEGGIPLSIDAPLFHVATVGAGEWDAGSDTGPAFLVQQDQLGSLRDQRALLDTLAEQVDDCPEALVFLAGDPPEIDSLRGLRQLATLMGLA